MVDVAVEIDVKLEEIEGGIGVRYRKAREREG